MLILGALRWFRGIGAFVVLDLDRGVVEPEAVLEPLLDGLHQPVAVLAVAGAGMQRHHAALLGDRPHMDVMNVIEARHIGDEVWTDIAGVEFVRRALEQDVP